MTAGRLRRAPGRIEEHRGELVVRHVGRDRAEVAESRGLQFVLSGNGCRPASILPSRSSFQRVGAPPTASMTMSPRLKPIAASQVLHEERGAFVQRQHAEARAAKVRHALELRLRDDEMRRLLRHAGDDAKFAALEGVDHQGLDAGNGDPGAALVHHRVDLLSVVEDLEARLDALVAEIAVLLGDPERCIEDRA